MSWTKKFTLQELRDAMFYHFKKSLRGMEWFQEIIKELFNQLWEEKVYPSDWIEMSCS